MRKTLTILIILYIAASTVLIIRNLNRNTVEVTSAEGIHDTNPSNNELEGANVIDQSYGLSEFVPMQLVNNTNVNSQNFFRGSYPIEDGHVWVNKEATITLQPQNEGQGDITIAGYMPYTSHQAADPSLKSVTITVYVNDSEVATETFDSDREFKIEIDKSKYEAFQEDNGDVHLKLISSSSFTPSETGDSKDKRELAYIVNSIKIN